MTTLNHVATGAVVAIWIKVAAIAIPVALLSHYLCDMVPHFGIYEDDHAKRNNSLFFKVVTGCSIVGSLLLLVYVPYHTSNIVAWATMLACMFAAALPDIVWVPLYIAEVKTKQEKSLGYFNQAHQAIQWYEKPLGLLVEIPWLFAALYVLYVVK